MVIETGFGEIKIPGTPKTNISQLNEKKVEYSQYQIDLQEIVGLSVDLGKTKRGTIEFQALKDRLELLIERYIKKRSNFMILTREMYDKVMEEYYRGEINQVDAFIILQKLSGEAIDDMHGLFSYRKIDI